MRGFAICDFCRHRKVPGIRRAAASRCAPIGGLKPDVMKQRFVHFAVVLLLSGLAYAADYNLGELARASKLELFNRSIDKAKTDSRETIFLNGAPDDGLAWVMGLELTEGTIEVEIKGKNEQGRSFVGIAFHGQDDRAFDAVYVRPFNFQSAEQNRRNHSIQYISMPEYDWKKLRDNHPGAYEFGITPGPDPNSWVKLKVVITAKNVLAFVDGSDKPSLSVAPLNHRLAGKVGLWVGNGSDGWFRNLKVIPTPK